MIENRYVTLDALLDCIPVPARAEMRMYRVKPQDVIDKSGRCIYIKKRYVAILSKGEHICTCLLGRHTGIPCQHFFAVINRFRTRHGFNISEVHTHWRLPSERERSELRQWIHLPVYVGDSAIEGEVSGMAKNTPDTSKAPMRSAPDP